MPIKLLLLKLQRLLCQLKLVEVWEELLYPPHSLVLQQLIQQVLQLPSLYHLANPLHQWLTAALLVKDPRVTVLRNPLSILMPRNFPSILQLKNSLQEGPLVPE